MTNAAPAPSTPSCAILGTIIHETNPETKELLDFVTLYTKRGSETWGGASYTFSALFECAGRSILACLTSERYAATSAIDQVMDRFYTVINGSPSYDTSSGIEVEYGE